VRRLGETDSMEELTALLHRAYHAQVQMGLHPLAGRQSFEITQQRTHSGECYVACFDGALVGTILLQEIESAAFPPHFQMDDVAHFSLFAVDPSAQGMGLGRRLLFMIEARAAELGFAHLACSMAEPDAALRRFYDRLGYAQVDTWQWPYTNYQSVILSKQIGI